MKKQKVIAFGKDVYLLGKDKKGIYYWLNRHHGIVAGTGASDMLNVTPITSIPIVPKI